MVGVCGGVVGVDGGKATQRKMGRAGGALCCFVFGSGADVVVGSSQFYHHVCRCLPGGSGWRGLRAGRRWPWRVAPAAPAAARARRRRPRCVGVWVWVWVGGGNNNHNKHKPQQRKGNTTKALALPLNPLSPERLARKGNNNHKQQNPRPFLPSFPPSLPPFLPPNPLSHLRRLASETACSGMKTGGVRCKPRRKRRREAASPARGPVGLCVGGCLVVDFLVDR